MWQKQPYVVIVIISLILFFPFLGNTRLFDWDEINFAECAREMIVSGDYLNVQINFNHFWEKPPFFFWMQALSMHMFGINAFAARLPNALMGVISLCTFYFIGKRHFSRQIAWLWIGCYLINPLSHLYFKSGIIDPWYNYFIFISIYFLYLSHESSIWKNSILSGLFLGLAVLTKGPVAVLLVLVTACIMLIVFPVYRKRVWLKVLLVSFPAVLIALIWLLPVYLSQGTDGIMQFFKYQNSLLTSDVAGHAQPFYYHLVVLLIGCFPISIFLLSKKIVHNNMPAFALWTLVLGAVTLVIFSIVKTKIIHYSSLCYIPMALGSALALNGIVQGELWINKIQKIIYIILSAAFSFTFIAAPLLMTFKHKWLRIIPDDFARANMNDASPWPMYLALLGILYLVSAIVFYQTVVKGYSFQKIMLSALGFVLFIQLCYVFILPRAEDISQRQMIQYIRAYSPEGVVSTWFKSYAPYFYAETKEPLFKGKQYIEQVTDELGINSYIICRISDTASILKEYPVWQFKESQSGYAVLQHQHNKP